MKIELEPQDIQAIADKVVEALLPLMPPGKSGDEVFDKQGVAEYLHVEKSWVDKQITQRAIPYFKMGKYTRFKKSHIDRWIEHQKVDPIPDMKSYRRGSVRG
jgi:excisionase family DNA binding protein